MNADELAELEALAEKMTYWGGEDQELAEGALALISDLRRAQETIDAIEDFVTRYYLDMQMGRRVLALIDPTTYDEGASDGK